MRAILIDPEKHTITEIDWRGPRDENDTSYLAEIYALLDCRSFTTGSRPLRGSMAEGFDSLYANNDYMDERGDPRFWFQVDADRNPPSSHPLAGRGLVVGVDDGGENCDAIISVAELQRRITFTQRKYRGIEISQGRGMLNERLFELMQIEVKAPIIDGTDEP